MNAKFLGVLGAAWVLAYGAGCNRRPIGSVSVATRGSAGSPAAAADTRPADSARSRVSAPRAVPIHSRDVAPIFERYCLGCHNSASAKGGVVLDVFRDGPGRVEHQSLLLRVEENLRSASMPPDGEPRPEPEELATLFAWLDAVSGSEASSPARITIRRLNRAEYNNTVRDLIGLDLRPADDFPADDIGYGFDNVGDVLAIPPILVEMYLSAAEKVMRESFRTAEIRDCIMTPPADAIPLVFRRYTPPVRGPRAEKRLRISVAGEDPELTRQQRIYNILRAFADKAFRRPATHDELMRLLAIVLSAEKDGEEPDDSIQLALRAVLTSPHFLLRFDQVRKPGSSGEPVPENDFNLAARLSYFLWSSMPDEELVRLAARGMLGRGETLRAQVGRMLRDPRSRALAENFAGQWLQTRKLRDFTPDPVQFPQFDESLRFAMLTETERFCRSIQDEDRSVLEFLDADYTFLNERLARHYGIAGVTGEQFRRVSVAGTPRGGILTQASILAVTSNPTRTSPVKRGKWILENILGVPPSPPPSGVEALKEGRGKGAAGTLRQRMERHRSDPACASCHRRMDPLGFCLENFDALGNWRTHEGDQLIDATGKLPGAREIRGPAELRASLLARRDAFVRCLTVKMLTYALGRGLQRADHRAIDRITTGLHRDGYRFSALIVAIVESDPFRNPDRKGEGVEQ